ncbi:MAG: PQQ-dependent sugar dehydrogenase [Pseudomonadaceae bacterium]|nr:PQQ-dependent sugar dehydrogenase [Pseudomonadaceae bacterium]
MAWWKILLISLLVVVLGGLGVAWYVMNYVELDIYVPLYVDNCASCHGKQMQGTDRGIALLGVPLSRGDNIDQLQDSIRQAHFDLGNPAFAGVLSDVEVKGLAIYIGERRMGQRFTDFRFDRDINIPSELQVSEEHNFTISTFAEGLDPMVFSIEPLPDGSMLLTEKERGLSIVSADGVQSELIAGTPETGSSIDIMGIQYGSGWLLDVATHPQYEDNGWIYLHYTHICGDDCGASMLSATMNRLDRGRIRDGQWVDVQTIWQAPFEYYSPTPDTGAGGRIAFDDTGHVYISVGIKSADGTSDTTPQDLDLPYGKILRLRDDGTIPLDNPYFVTAKDGSTRASAVTPAIWSYGHRSPQGLEWHPERGTVWDSEMGPRGGDELNELLPGRNYGWPYVSGGLEYSGYVVERHKPKAIEFDETVSEYSLVDITPSPAISSFAFYTGDQFPNWQNNVLIGSLKGSSLFRMAFDGRRLIHQETLIKDLARIRDVEVGYDGIVYLLLENEAGSSIVKLTPG